MAPQSKGCGDSDFASTQTHVSYCNDVCCVRYKVTLNRVREYASD